MSDKGLVTPACHTSVSLTALVQRLCCKVGPLTITYCSAVFMGLTQGLTIP